ncbi:fibronectin type III domain-containing protein [Collibacillus ludicampi]|uniref:fibronectin type III domain-containing protein n=1 Tax=Collibacillus ludicampi TaxID=2771369 RepID=UPI0024949901|nr:fibronectin type III domain-containing protein [Collibacillus ludicampi]
MYKIVPAINGELDIDYKDLIHAIDNGDGTYIVHLEDTAVPRPSWKDVTQDQWDQATKGISDPLTLAIKQKQAELQFDSDQACATFVSSAIGSPHTYLADEKSLAYLQGEYTFVTGPHYDGSPVNYYTVESGFVNHTANQIVQVFLDGRAWINQQKGIKLATKLKQLNACTTVDQVNSIVWNDTTPPNAPTGLQGTAGTGQVTLTWTENSEIDVQIGGGYNIYEGSTKVNASPVTGTSYTVTGLTSGTSYTFTITAVDSDGNESAHSASVTVTAN